MWSNCKYFSLYYLIDHNSQGINWNICCCCCCCSLVTNSCLTFMTPWAVAHQVPLSKGFPRQNYWSGVQFPSPGDLPNQGLNLCSISAFKEGGFFITEPPGKLQDFSFPTRDQTWAIQWLSVLTTRPSGNSKIETLVPISIFRFDN